MATRTQIPAKTQYQPQQRSQGGRKANKRRLLPWLIAGGALMIGFMMIVGIAGIIAVAYLSDDRIPSGVSVAGVDVGGRSMEAATRHLQAQNLAALQSITATDGERQWQVSLADLGVSVDINASIQAAQDASSGEQVRPWYTVDLNQAQVGLVALSERANIDAVPGNPPQIGRVLEIPVMLDRLRVDVTGELADGVFDLTMMDVEPEETEALSTYNGETTTHVVESGQELALIAREYGVSMEDVVELNGIDDPDLLWVGQELTIPAGGAFTPVNVPSAPTNNGRSIVVSVSEQRIYAYENGQFVRQHLVSTGRSQTPTVLGDYSVYVKYEADDMRGPDYFLPQVPYTMYFYQGYAIHGTYWHNSFGRQMSHGCVNLPVDEAQWFFNFASVGTPVRVIA